MAGTQYPPVLLPPPASDDSDNLSTTIGKAVDSKLSKDSAYQAQFQPPLGFTEVDPRVEGTQWQKANDYLMAAGTAVEQGGTALKDYLQSIWAKTPTPTEADPNSTFAPHEQLGVQGNVDTLPLKESYNATDQYQNPVDRRQEIADQRLTGSKGPNGGVLVPTETYRHEYQPDPLGDVNTVLQPLMIPAYAGGSLVAAAGAALPEKGELHGVSAVDDASALAGNILDSYASHWFANSIQTAKKIGTLALPAQPLVVAKSLYDTAVQPDGDSSDYGQIGHNLYQGLSSGEIWRRTQADRSSEISSSAIGAGVGFVAGSPLGGPGMGGGALLGAKIGAKIAPDATFSYPMLRGVHVLDAAIPPELANRLLSSSAGKADTLSGSAESLLWSALGTHAGREIIGGSMEMAGDPMNWWGPAGASQRLLHRGAEYEVSAPVLRGASAYETATGTPFTVAKGVMADLVHGDESIKAAAKAKVEDAFSELSRRYVDAQGRLNVELAKPVPNEFRVKTLKSEAAFAGRGYDDLERSTSLLRAGSPNGYMQPVGHFAVHIPGSDSTYFADQLLSPISDSVYGKKLIKRINEVPANARKGLIDVTGVDWGGLESRAAANRLNRPSALPETAGMSKADRTAWLVKKTLGLSDVKLYRQTFQAINQVLGSRFVEPLLHTAAETHHAVASASKEAAERFALSLPYQRIAKGLNSEAYQKGQEAVTRVLSQLQSRYDLLNRYIKNIAKHSNIAHGYQLRQKAIEAAKVEERLGAIEFRLKESIPYEEQRALRAEKMWLLNRKAEVEYWGTAEHTASDIMDRAFDYVARGAGWEAPVEMRPAVDEWQKLYDEIQGSVSDEDRVAVSNLMAAVGRRGVGDPTMENALRAGMAQVKDYMLNGDFERLQALANARLFQVGGLSALVEDLSPQGLARVLERVLKLTGPVAREREAIAEVLGNIIPDAGMVEDLLGRATVITGDKNPYDAVMTLANMMRGDGAETMDKKLSGLMDKWHEDEQVLRALSMGEYTPELRDAASNSAVTASLQRRIAQLRGKVGSADWDGFLKWASDEQRTAGSDEWESHLLTWKRLETQAATAADVRGGSEALMSKLRAQLTDNMIGAERVQAALSSEARFGGSRAKEAIVKALDRVLDVEHPVIRALADDIADQILKDATVLESPESLAVGASARRDVASFETEIKKVEPRFVYPPESKYNPPDHHDMVAEVATKMDDLERNTYASWLDIKKRHNLSDEQALYVAMSALVNSPDIPNALEWADTAKRYDGVFGTRFMPVPDDMQDAVKMARALIASYEDMFRRSGLDILKSPYRLMKEEGVAEYAPKLRVQRSDVALGPKLIDQLDTSSAWIGSSVDSRLDTELDAEKRRQSVGTARELNAWADDASDHVYSYRPAFLLSRYLQTNKAISAKEFLDELALLGVTRSFTGGSQVSRHVAAAAEGFVPLFKQGDHEFAGWLADTKEVREAYKLEGILGSMPEHDQLVVEDLAEQGQFEQVAAMMQEAAKKEVPLDQVERYFGADSVRRMYVPDSFHQSLHDVFDMGRPGGIFHVGLEHSARWIKPWLTMIHTAYHATNALGNTFQRIVDLGAFGAMNMKTLLMASRLHAAGAVADRWGGGSLQAALDVLGENPRVGHGLAGRIGEAVDKTELAAWRYYADSYLLDRAAKEGLDLGDGLLREADEALRILRENKVIDMHFGHQIDVGHAEALVGENHLLGKYNWPWQFAKGTGNVAIVALPMLAGSPVPVTVGFKYGEILGKTIENQAKLTNFVGSMRRVPSISDAAASVARRYFQYLDLTSFQRMHLRTLFPFITWPLKNVHVQFEQMARNPAFYSWYSRFLLETAPRISQAMESDNDNTAYVPIRPYDERAGMDDWGYAEFRVPLGESLGGSQHAVMTGFKDPLSTMVGTVGGWSSAFTNPLSRAHLYGGRTGLNQTVAQMHWYLSVVPDLVLHDKAYDSVAGKPIGDETEAADLRTVLEAVYSLPKVGPAVAGYMASYAGFYQLWERDRETGDLVPAPYAAPGVNYVIKKSQLSRLLRSATKSAEDELRFQAASILNEEVTDVDGVPYDPRPSDPTWDVLGVLMGPRLDLEAPSDRLRKMERAVDKASQHESTEAGATSQFTTTTIRK